jgi:nitrilase
MPLLRHSLYSQNVNLYLAPTADGRDTWLPLMRTVACEGRCFVLSANQCVKKGDLPGWIHGEEKDEEECEEVSKMHVRKASVVTEEGNEIILPLSKEKSDWRSISDEILLEGVKPHGRKRPVVTENGHEIVLPLSPKKTDLGNAPTFTGWRKPELFKGKSSSSEFVSRGGSCIISPFGEVLAGPLWENDSDLLIADVDFDDCLRGRLDLDVAGSYSRLVARLMKC